MANTGDKTKIFTNSVQQKQKIQQQQQHRTYLTAEDSLRMALCLDDVKFSMKKSSKKIHNNSNSYATTSTNTNGKDEMMSNGKNKKNGNSLKTATTIATPANKNALVLTPNASKNVIVTNNSENHNHNHVSNYKKSINRGTTKKSSKREGTARSSLQSATSRSTQNGHRKNHFGKIKNDQRTITDVSATNSLNVVENGSKKITPTKKNISFSIGNRQ